MDISYKIYAKTCYLVVIQNNAFCPGACRIANETLAIISILAAALPEVFTRSDKYEL